jgi:hypothetical protein
LTDFKNDDRGMVPREKWEQTSVHKASTYYCAKCGRRFKTPHDVYDHLDTAHPKGKDARRGNR